MKNKLTRLSIMMLVGLIAFGALVIFANPFNFASSPLHSLGLFQTANNHSASSNLRSFSGSTPSGSRNSTSPSSGISQTPIGGQQSKQKSGSDDGGSFSGSDN